MCYAWEEKFNEKFKVKKIVNDAKYNIIIGQNPYEQTKLHPGVKTIF